MMNYWKETRIPHGKFGRNYYHNKWARKLLIHKYNCAKENSLNIIKHRNVDKLSGNALLIHIIDIITNTIKEYEEKSLNDGVPQLFIDKFNKWHTKTVDMVLNCVNNICESNYYHSNYEKIYAIFNIFISAFEVTLVDAEKTLKTINGELDKYITEYDRQLHKDDAARKIQNIFRNNKKII